MFVFLLIPAATQTGRKGTDKESGRKSPARQGDARALSLLGSLGPQLQFPTGLFLQWDAAEQRRHISGPSRFANKRACPSASRLGSMEPSQMKLSNAILGHGDYDSDFSDDENSKKSALERNRNEDALLTKPFQKEKQSKVVHRQVVVDEWDREEARNRRFHFIAMDAYGRHKKLVNDYILFYGGKKEDFKRSGANDKTDLDIVRENHRFLWKEEDEVDMTWEKRLSKKYYDKLFKEYCVADLTKYKENKFGFRWRHEKEVISGKGQFSCGNKHCDEKEGLKSWEVNFGYVEHEEKKNALVKLRLCPECSYKLNFHHRRKEVKPKKKRASSEQGSEVLKSKKSKLSSSQKHKKKKKHKDQGSFEETDDSDKGSGSSDDQDGPSDGDFWKGPLQDTTEKTREEEFDEYFQDLFL
ncbi:protein FRA10AC1 [Sphaerodactylus townsendi]|uniref:protein FRA10AC1 n=1 Tax=Sphaerodactylus townsendi TaxID=933632 RepID=UPI00202745FF|nr:protein FRA10AC1 [Sphaerodactylus townsendi]